MTLRFSSSGAAIAVAILAAGSAAAQTAAPVPGAAPADALADIIVTAQKRPTNLQTTPISISVLDGNDLADRHVAGLEDLQDGSIPSLRIAPFFSRSSALTLDIRGIGAQVDANQPNRDQGVGVYVDGVYLGRAQGLGTAMFDVAQIEVLKGPQGTLFGRNTEGGAVSITTRKPSGVFKMDTTFGVSNFGGYKAETHIDLPSWHDISLKFDGILDKRDGTVKNPLAGQLDFNAFDKRGLRIQSLWAPTGTFSARYAFDISYDATTPYYVQLFTPGLLAPGIPVGSTELSPLVHLQPTRAGTGNFGVPLQYSVGKTDGHMLILDWNAADHLEIKSISAYRHLAQSQYDDGETNIGATFSTKAPDGSFGRYSQANFYQKQYSQELQMIGSLPRLSYVGGLFFYLENVHDNAWTPNPLEWNGSPTSYTVEQPPIAVSPFPDRASKAMTRSLAAFGQATWTPAIGTDLLHLTLGGRYTNDHKTGTLELVNGALPVLNPGLPDQSVGTLSIDLTEQRFDPLVNLAIDASRDVHFYGKWSTGYKSGGANSRSYTYRAFGSESVSAFEIGMKTEFFDHRVRFDIDGFTEAYRNPQIDFSALIVGSNRGTVETVNAQGTGRSKGVEAELDINPAKGLTLSASYTYVKETLPIAYNPFAGNAATLIYPLYTPPNAASGSLNYEIPLQGAKLRLHVDANYADRQQTSAFDPTASDTSFIVNGRLALADIVLRETGATLQVAAWARNLFDEQHAFLRNTNVTLGSYGIFNEPRTFGVEGNVKF